ncbi:MAG: putative N10-methylenetetrahydromethanopterin reductase-related protein [Aeromicrobium sp.]|nr:putative N10-methylenetetrahydromethanopterin reductase-related protein [Aeromicrobium sp.]
MTAWGMPWPGAEIAAKAEAAGATAFCAGEFADVNSYLTTAEMVAGTTTAMVGPGIAYAFARSPFIHASSIRHLHRSAPGRLFLALGSGTPRMNADWFSVDASRPASRMADLIRSVRAYLDAENDEKIVHHGDFYDIDADIRAPIFGKLDVPILVGAFNGGMLRMTGRVADGVLGHGLFTDAWWSEVVIPEMTTGAESVDRDPTELKRWGWVITAIDDDEPEKARDDARKQVGFYLTVRTYDPLVALHGWEAEVETIRSAFRSGDIPGMIAAVTDEMIDAITLSGTTAHAKELLASRQHIPHQAFFSTPNFLVGRRKQAAYSERSIALFT